MSYYFTAAWRDSAQNLYAARNDGKVFFRTEEYDEYGEEHNEDAGVWKHDPRWDCPQDEFEQVERIAPEPESEELGDD